MSAFDYVRTAATATRLLTRFGTPGKLTQKNPKFNASTGTSKSATIYTDIYYLQMDVADVAREMNALDLKDGEQAGYMTPIAVPPQKGDSVVLTNKSTGKKDAWKVGVVYPLQPGGLVVMFKVQLTQ